jgi:hypothetical protein
MAGAGFKVFVDGDVLTATQVNTYLQQQAVMAFATATARDTAITSPSEGMVAYLLDSNNLTYYNGSAWAGLDLADGTLTRMIADQTQENWNIVASAATGTINFDARTASIWYYTSNATANFTLNIRGNSTTTLSSMLAVGDSITVAFFNTNGATAYYPNVFQIDGSAVTPKWQGGTAPSAGNASSIDAYVYSIVKTAATPTYTVFGSQTRFA